MDILMNNLSIFLPLIVIQVVFSLIALVHVLRHPHYRFGNRVMWALIVMIISFFGPIVYFVFGRSEEQ